MAYTITTAKEQAVSKQPLLLAKFTFPDGTVLRLSTHPLNTAEGGQQYAGVDWLGRLRTQDIDQLQALSDTGVDLVASVSLTINDPDGYIEQNYERAAGCGFKGAEVELRLVMVDLATWEFSTDSRVPFVGICDKPEADARTLRVRAVAKTNLLRAQLPVLPLQPRCPHRNPDTVAKRSDASNPDSPYYECGETRDLTTAPPCSYTKATCTQPNRFGGIVWAGAVGGRFREYTSGSWNEAKANPNELRPGDYAPMVYGTAWVEPPVISVIPDGNYTRGEAVVCSGEVGDILRVVCNDTELSPTNTRTGTAYSAANRDYRWAWVNDGKRTGAPNPDVPWSGSGDPYGSMAAIMWLAPRSVVSGMPRLRVLVQGPKLRKYVTIASAVVSSEVCTVTFYGQANTDLAGASTSFTIEGNSTAALNGTWSGMTNWTYGPPGTIQFPVPGVANGTGTGGMIRYAAQTENPIWQICDILTWTNYRYTGIDIYSAIAAAEVLKDRNSAFVIKSRRSAQEIIRGIRAAHGILLSLDPATGLLRFHVKQTLAAQQPSAVTGSNTSTPITSKLADGTAANGYAAYAFGNANILKTDSDITSLRELGRTSADAPNKIQLAYQDRTLDYATSTINVYESDDVARMGGQEITGNLAAQPEGLTSQADAMRAARVNYAEMHRGNSAGDTRGTRVFEFETTTKPEHLRLGDLVTVTDARKGLSNQLCRVIRIQPAPNYETTRLTVAYHNDDWYTDAWATAAQTTQEQRRRDALDRPAFAWLPNEQAPQSGDTFYASTEKSFALAQAYEDAADGTKVARLSVAGKAPVNALSSVAAPRVPLQATVATTGGTIGGNRVVWIALCSKDANGYGPQSALVRADVPSGTNTNTITVGSIVWPAGATGHAVFAGTDPNRLSFQSEAASTPNSITLTSLTVAAWGVPDPEFDAIVVRVKRIYTGGIRGYLVTSTTGTTITVTGAGWTSNEWADRDVTLYNLSGTVPLFNARVASNTSDTLTLAGSMPSPTVGSFGAASVLVIHAKASSNTATTFTDTKANFTVDALIGKLVRVIAGTGAGIVARITDNDATSITAPFGTTLDSTSRIIVEEPEWIAEARTGSLTNTDPAQPVSLTIEVPNLAGVLLLVQASTVDGGGNEAPMNPVRSIYLSGGTVTPGTATPPSKVTNPQSITVSATDPNIAKVTGQWDLPTTLNNFDGCEVFRTIGGGQPVHVGHSPHPVGGGGPFAFELRIPCASTEETNRLWFVSRSAAVTAELVTAAGATQTPYVDVTIPARPAVTDEAVRPTEPGDYNWWSVTNPDAADYVNDATGRAVAKICRLTVNTAVDGATAYQQYVYPGSSRPTDPNHWIPAGSRVGTGRIDEGFAVDRPDSNQTWAICCVPQLEVYAWKPTATTPFRTITVSARGASQAPTNTSIRAFTTGNGTKRTLTDGKSQYKYLVEATINQNDVNFDAVGIRIRRSVISQADLTNQAWETWGGASKGDFVILDQSNPSQTVVLLGNTGSDDWWEPGPPLAAPNAAYSGWAEIQVYTKNHAGAITYAAASNMIAVPAGELIDASKLKNLGSNVSVVDGKLIAGKDGPVDLDFEGAGIGWTFGTGASIDATGGVNGSKALKLTPQSGGVYAQAVQIWPIAANSKQLRLSARSKNTSNVIGSIAIGYYDSSFAFLAGEGVAQVVPTGVSAYTVYEVIARPRPANAAFIGIVLTADTTGSPTGAIWFDMLEVTDETAAGASTASVAGASATTSSADLSYGPKQYWHSISWNIVTPRDPQRARIAIDEVVGAVTRPLGEWDSSIGSALSRRFTCESESSQAGTLKLYWVSQDGQRSGTSTDVSVTIPGQKTKALDLAKVDGYARFGGSSQAKGIAIYASNGTDLIGAIGDWTTEISYRGAWFQALRIGPNAATPVIESTSSGVQINGAPIQLTGTQIKVEILKDSAGSDGTFCGLRVLLNADVSQKVEVSHTQLTSWRGSAYPSQYAYFSQSGIGVYRDGGSIQLFPTQYPSLRVARQDLSTRVELVTSASGGYVSVDGVPGVLVRNAIKTALMGYKPTDINTAGMSGDALTIANKVNELLATLTIWQMSIRGGIVTAWAA